MFRFDLWEEALEQTNIKADYYLRERNHDEELPWDSIDCGVEKTFLLEEERKAISGEFTSDCRLGSCRKCGVCDHKNIKVITAVLPQVTAEANKEKLNTPSKQDIFHESQKETEKTIRLRYSKVKAARYLSHLELSEALIRSIKRSGISFVYTQGFHPHPKISFSSATSVGMESMDEYAVITVVTDKSDANAIEEINLFLPEGLKVQQIEAISSKNESLNKTVQGFCYSIFLPDDLSFDITSLEEKIKHFLGTDLFLIIREVKGKMVEKNIRPIINSLQLDANGSLLQTSIKITREGSVRPLEILTEVLGMKNNIAIRARIVRTKTLFDEF